MYIKNLAHLILVVILATTMSPAFAEQTAGDALDNMAKDFDTFVQKTGVMVQDAAISAAITTKFMLDKNLSAYNIDTKSQNGVVTLTGEVNTQSEINNAIALANATNGVKSVDASKLIVKKSDQPVADLAITTKIKTLFLKEKLFGDMDLSSNPISVETKNGVVYLTGSAENAEQANKAVKLAESVSGVVKVISNLAIGQKDNE